MIESNLRCVALMSKKEVSLSTALGFSQEWQKLSPNRGVKHPARPTKTTWELTPGILHWESVY